PAAEIERCRPLCVRTLLQFAGRGCAMSGSGTCLTYVDRTKPDPYIMSPRDMIEYDEASPLTPTARLVRMYLHDLSRRPGWKIYVAQVQRALGLSPGVWVRARRELEAAGYY